MKALFLCLVPVALSAFGERQETPLAPIFLYTQFQQQPPPAVVDALQDEVGSIMSPTGLRFSWRVLSATSGDEVAAQLAVITFKGGCAATGLTPQPYNPGPLGWTHISGGVILPFAEVDCQGIRDFIQKQLLTMPAEHRDEAYGRALGRVLAHELYHIFANTTRHGSCGVGKSKYTVRELLSPKFQFGASETFALKTSRAHAVLEWAAFRR